VIATKVYSRVGPGRNDIWGFSRHIMDGVRAVSAFADRPLSTVTRSMATIP